MKAVTLLRRTAAVAAAVSGVLHILMLGHGGLFWWLAMVAMALACFPCAGHLWRRPSLKSWMLLGAMNAGMVTIHLWMMAAAGSLPDAQAGSAASIEDAGHHQHHAAGAFPLPHEQLFHLATGLALFEVGAALVAVIFFRSRLRQAGAQGFRVRGMVGAEDDPTLIGEGRTLPG